MPVDDHPIHPRTIRADGTLWGCNNAKRADGYWASNGYKMAQIGECGHKVVLSQMIWVKNSSSTVCHSPVRHDDPACEGGEKLAIDK